MSFHYHIIIFLKNRSRRKAELPVLRDYFHVWGKMCIRDRIIVFAATLGCGADHLIQKYSRLQMSRAVVCLLYTSRCV